MRRHHRAILAKLTGFDDGVVGAWERARRASKVPLLPPGVDRRLAAADAAITATAYPPAKLRDARLAAVIVDPADVARLSELAAAAGAPDARSFCRGSWSMPSRTPGAA